MLVQGLGQRAAMLLAAAASADRGILPLLRAVLGPDELYALVTVALLGSYANDLVRTKQPYQLHPSAGLPGDGNGLPAGTEQKQERTAHRRGIQRSQALLCRSRWLDTLCCPQSRSTSLSSSRRSW